MTHTKLTEILETAVSSSVEIKRGIYQIAGAKPSCHTYLIRSRTKNVLIDTGTNVAFDGIAQALGDLGLATLDIHLIINTHEHFDHIGCNRYFEKTALLAAHRLAATKIERQDEYVTMHSRCRGCMARESCDLQSHSKDSWLPTPQLWLEDGTFFDLGDSHLKIIHTPGHTSGCISVYEPERRILFSGDTVLAGGTLSAIAPSGSAGDYINSLHRLATLKMDLILPGHGHISDRPEEDLAEAIEHAKTKLREARVLGGSDTWTESTPLESFLQQGSVP